MYNNKLSLNPDHWNKIPDNIEQYDISLEERKQFEGDVIIGTQVMKRGSYYYVVYYKLMNSNGACTKSFALLYDYDHMHKLLENVKVHGVKLDSIGRIISDDSYSKEKATANEDIYKLKNAIYKYVYRVLASKKGYVAVKAQSLGCIDESDDYEEEATDYVFDQPIANIVKQYLKKVKTYKYSYSLAVYEIADLVVNLCDDAVNNLESKGIAVYKVSSTYLYNDEYGSDVYYTSSPLSFFIDCIKHVSANIDEYVFNLDENRRYDILKDVTCPEYIYMDHFVPTISYDLMKVLREKNSLKPIAYKLPMMADYWLSLNELELGEGYNGKIIKFNPSAENLLNSFSPKMNPDDELKKIHYNLLAYNKHVKKPEAPTDDLDKGDDSKQKVREVIDKVRKLYPNKCYMATEEETIALLAVIDLYAKRCDYRFGISKDLDYLGWRKIELKQLGIIVSFEEDDTYTHAIVYGA